jgi:RNA recognition motif-containing protein
VKVKNVKIMRDKNTGSLMGYGFIEFDTKEEASEALQLMNGKPMPNSNNKVFKLNWASYSQGKNSSNQNPNEYSIYVCELDPSVNEEILQNYFKQYFKSVIGAKIVVDPSTKVSKGYGFVKFSDQNESHRALNEMNGKLINGKPMKINTAAYKKNQEKKSNFPGNTTNNNINNSLMYDAQALYNMQNDPNLLQQQYLSQLYLNGYYYQLYAQLYSQLQNMTPEQQQQYLLNQLQTMTPEQQQQFLMILGYQNVGQSNDNNNNNTNTANVNNGNQQP